MPTTEADPALPADAASGHPSNARTTPRLRLRPVDEADAGAVRTLAGDAQVAEKTASIPHPLSVEAARAWLAPHLAGIARGSGMTFAIEARGHAEDGGPRSAGRGDAAFIGVVGVHRRAATTEAGCGYWLGRAYWGRGYMTEALASAVGHAFETFGFDRIEAAVFPGNPASRAVLAKAGFVFSKRALAPAPARGGDREVEWFTLDRPVWRARTAAGDRPADRPADQLGTPHGAT